MSTLFLELISILVNDMYFLFLLFANMRHNHELIRVKHESYGSTKVYDGNVAKVRDATVIS